MSGRLTACDALGNLRAVTILQHQYPIEEDSLGSRPSKAWLGPELMKADVTHSFSPDAEAEIVAHLRNDLNEAALSCTRAEIEQLRHRVDEVHGFAIVAPLPSIGHLKGRRAVASLIGRLLGEPMPQSGDGIEVVHVYDRDRTRRMQDGARYHQTRQGGSIHTDNVNRLETWDYLIMACLFPAMIGGESILVSGFTVYDLLRACAARALEILSEDFWWECRGFSDDDFFRAPVLSFKHRGEPQFRYLRDYLESAHRRTGEPLREEQTWALDTLDSALELSELQFRHRLAPGEILVIDDKQMFHGRTSFSDFFAAAPYEPGSSEAGRPVRRCLDRLWIRKRAA